MQEQLAPLMPYIYVLTAVFGLVMGSFLNCMAWRMCNGESVMEGRSHCTTCGHVLGAKDLVPVLSWLSTKGTCRYCGAKVSWRYPATELLCAVIYVSIMYVYGPTLEAIELIGFASVLLVLTLTDLETYTIPNVTIVVALGIRVAYLVANSVISGSELVPALIDALVGGVAVVVPIFILTLVMDFVLGKPSFGYGDIKLLFVCGTYFGWQQSLFLIMLSCILGLLGATLIHPKGGKTDDDATMENKGLIPFGPAIAVASWICMLVGKNVVAWYLGLFGL